MKLLRFVSVARSTLPRVVPLMRHGRVPVWLKGATIVGALFIISPFNLLGDIPLLGILDDVTLLALLGTLFVNVATMLLRKDEAASPMRVVGPTPLPAAARPTP